jgi:CRP-like cAMP-binding protein
MLSSQFLYKIPIFSDLSIDTLNIILKAGSIKNYKINETILTEEQDGVAFIFIINGRVKLSRKSEEGRDVIITILYKDEFFGEMAIFDGRKKFTTVSALEDSIVFILRRVDFLDMLHEYPEISINLLGELTKRLSASEIKIKALSTKDAEGKVATLLLQIADDFGQIKKGKVEIDRLPLQNDLAKMAGTSRETISRTLHSFAKKGFVELDGNKLRFNQYEKFRELFS